MTPLIEASGFIKRFGKTAALDGLDLVAEPGQILAVLGRTGPGRPRSSARWPPCCGWTPGQCAGVGGRRDTPQTRAPAQKQQPSPR